MEKYTGQEWELFRNQARYCNIESERKETIALEQKRSTGHAAADSKAAPL